MSTRYNGKRYNDDFKKMIVDLYQSGSSVKDLSNEYGVSDVTIYKWIKDLTPIEGTDGKEITPKDVDAIQKENLRLKQELENLKKGYGHIRSKVSDSELTEFITEHKDDYTVRTMCETLGIPKSTYYQSLNKAESNRDRGNREFTEKIIRIHEESKKRYGAPKIHEILEKQGHKISLKRVQRLMKEAGIRSIIVKKFRPTPSKEKVEERENIMNRDFSTTTINQKWVGDITYIHTLRDGWCYLASVLDLHSRKIIGYSFGRSMTTELVEQALENAYVSQKPNDGVLFHSDLGSQYTSDAFVEKVQSCKMTHSFSHKGSPYDNACIESFHAILKKEEVNHVQYLDFNAARVELFKYIEGWYNRKRIHGSIGYLTLQEMEDLALQQAA
ncbi:IS3 family transposase [Gracilibacillus alcaliphilus]|uniref:IS3 family transposase n=1 Tax=Gracilibacillus alcaliphilus TaxID=1401441 RepID=UPI001959BCAC|nr:IS3 family transposase [Gracilibacillus alcaliphilus]